MTRTYIIAAASLWLAWLVSWQIAALWRDKPTVRGPRGDYRVHFVIISIGMILIYGVNPARQPLLWHVGPVLGWSMVSLTGAGIAFAIGRVTLKVRRATDIGHDHVVREERAIGVQVLGVIGVELRLSDSFDTQRSISPKTMSRLPRMAETSASRWPRFIQSMAARCGKPGARILQRCGLLVPSATR